MLGVLARIPLYFGFRQVGWPRMLPINLTLSPSPRCNSRCLTCNIWMKRETELRLDEWDRILSSVGMAPYWITVSGGEPFLFEGVVDLCEIAYRRCRPGIINIPTNGLLFNRIPEAARQIARRCPGSQLIINLSLDGVGQEHDRIRGVPGNFVKSENCLAELLALRKETPNLAVGIHTVVSVFNIDRLDQVAEYALASGADQFITEIAEPRVELDTVGLPITPDRESYDRAIDRLTARIAQRDFQGVARITEAFRIEYYRLVKRVLQEQRQVIPCYAGWASAQIYADGTVWPCCVRADNLGNLREVEYDFRKIWFADQARRARRSIGSRECYCPLANASYTNMLHHIPTASRVGMRVLFAR
jgi:MoaA/NifB/PqqE/SkfB family radical SAM enzyme